MAEVTSGRHRYGHLWAILPEGASAFPEERSLLRTYAELAAAALDVATSLERVRAERSTAESLWRLANELAAVTDPAEAARRLARVTPEVVGSDRAAVFLYDEASASLRCEAVHGLEGPARATFLGVTLTVAEVPLLQEVLDHQAPRFIGSATRDPFIRELLEVSGAEAAVVIPLARLGRLYGILVADTSADQAATQADSELLRRLHGLASQSVTALENAHLMADIKHRATHDALTGLPNRAVLIEHIDALRASSGADPAALLFIDLDDFKTINDSLGHGAGDHALVEVGRRLAACVPRDTVVVRLGGDEFAVLLTGNAAREAEPVADRVLAELAEPHELEGRHLRLHASIGISPDVHLTASVGDALRDADTAMYAAKEGGKRRHASFRCSMHEDALVRLELASDLERAIEGGELRIHFQPIIDPRSGRVAALESLVRWAHPDRGLLSPDQFLPIAAEVGLARQIDSWVLGRAVTECRRWQEQWPKADQIAVTVNVSPNHLDDPLVEEIVALTTEVGLLPGRLILEMVENLSLLDPDAARRAIGALRERGVRTALDDFGTGFSSLSHLEHLPVDFVKIDRSLTTRATTDERSSALMAGVIDLCRRLGVRTAAEGVETPQQQDHATQLGCDFVQGYLVARPFPGEEVDRFIEHWEATFHPAHGVSREGLIA